MLRLCGARIANTTHRILYARMLGGAKRWKGDFTKIISAITENGKAVRKEDEGK